MAGTGWREQDGVVRGWQVGAVGACVVGAMALFGQAAWAQVVTPQPWPGVVGAPIMVGGPEQPVTAAAPGRPTAGPALDPTAASTSTALPTDPSGTISPSAAEPTAASTSDAPAPLVRAPAAQPTTGPLTTGAARTTPPSAPRVVTPNRVVEIDDHEDEDEDEVETKSATSKETSDSHESDKDDD